MNPIDPAGEKRAMFLIYATCIITGLLLLFIVISIFTSCTVSCINTCSVGSASDTVDAPLSTDADVKPTLDVPVKLTP